MSLNLKNRVFQWLILLLVISSCKSRNIEKSDFAFNKSLLDSLFKNYGENIAILTYLRCNCFVEAYNKEYMNKKGAPEGYALLADTTCTQLVFPVTHFPANVTDSLSEDIYNLTLIKRRSRKVTSKILSIDESLNLESNIKDFFR